MSWEDSKSEKEYLLFAGNPGVGKSTIQNCIIRSRNPNFRDEDLFKSGLSFGSGMTFQLDRKEVNGIHYMDTPGLEDTKMRKQAAEAITKALKTNGIYQIIFVVTLEDGRVRPADVTTIALILGSAQDIKCYGIIFNKIGKRTMKMLDQDKNLRQRLISTVTIQEGIYKPIAYALFLPEIVDLKEEDNAVTDIPEIKPFLENLPSFHIKAKEVKRIPIDQFEELKEHFEKKMSFYKEQQEAMEQKMKEDRERFEECKTKVDSMRKQGFFGPIGDALDDIVQFALGNGAQLIANKIKTAV